MSEFSWNEIKQQVHERAAGCCEYCQTDEKNIGQTMHVDHIDPKGGDILDNLCLACWNCNSYKHKATHAIDPQTNQQVALFNPRTQLWTEHFEWVLDASQINGLTPIGRATVERLKMNRPRIIIARQRWAKNGYHPPNFGLD